MLKKFICWCLLLVALNSCGYKGPLVLPTPNNHQQTPLK